MAKRKRCTQNWIDEATRFQAFTNGQSYYGVAKDALTRKGTVRKGLQKEARCQGLKVEKRHRGGFETEIYLVPIKGRRRRTLPLAGGEFTFDGVRCRDSTGAFVPVSQCKGPVGRDAGGRFVSIKDL